MKNQRKCSKHVIFTYTINDQFSKEKIIAISSIHVISSKSELNCGRRDAW